MQTTNAYTTEQLQQAAAILDAPRGQSMYTEGPMQYPTAAELLVQGADIVALAKARVTEPLDLPGDTYEFLFEECEDFVAFSQLIACTPEHLVQALLEFTRAAFAFNHSWANTFEGSTVWLERMLAAQPTE